MGCAQSKIDNEEVVSRCKQRRNLMKDAVIARNAFAAGQSAYSISLKNIGAALSDYGHDASKENQEQQHQQPMDPAPQPPPPPPLEGLPPPPPPLPNFSPSPIKRSASLPSIPLKSRKHPQEMENFPINEDDEEEVVDGDEEEEEEEEEGAHGNNGGDKHKLRKHMGGPHGEMSSTPPRTPEMGSVPNAAWDYFFMVDHNLAGPSLSAEQNMNTPVTLDEENENENGNGNGVARNENNNTRHVIGNNKNKNNNNNNAVTNNDVNEAENTEKKAIDHARTAPPDFGNTNPTVSLMHILNEIDDHFLKASQSTYEVTNLLEATRLHYHSNFADNRAHIDHSARVMRVITWNRSFRGISNGDGGKEELDTEENETLANILDKMLAWEKKLYEEVKQGELMKLEYQRKVALLNKQKKREASLESLEKTKAAVSHLHTRYIVDMQSMDSTVCELNRLRDEQLYPRLVALVDAMSKMWGSICRHHDSQLEIVTDLKSLNVAHASMETTEQHYGRTKQLCEVIQEWHVNFEKFVNHQKQYIHALNSWLKLNLIPFESNLKEKVSSPPRAQNPPIQALVHAWHDILVKLPDELGKSAISSFGAVIQTILDLQVEEMKQKEKCRELESEYYRKKRAYEEWHHKYSQRKNTSDESEIVKGEDANTKDPVSEREDVVTSLRTRCEEAKEAHSRYCDQVRDKSLGTLKIKLPELFRALSDYAHASCDAYEKLRSITTRSQISNGGSSQ